MMLVFKPSNTISGNRVKCDNSYFSCPPDLCLQVQKTIQNVNSHSLLSRFTSRMHCGIAGNRDTLCLPGLDDIDVIGAGLQDISQGAGTLLPSSVTTLSRSDP